MSPMCRLAKLRLVKNYDMDLHQTLTNQITCLDCTYFIDSEYILDFYIRMSLAPNNCKFELCSYTICQIAESDFFSKYW